MCERLGKNPYSEILDPDSVEKPKSDLGTTHKGSNTRQYQTGLKKAPKSRGGKAKNRYMRSKTLDRNILRDRQHG